MLFNPQTSNDASRTLSGGDRFEAIGEQLEALIDHTREAGIIVSDFQPQATWHGKLMTIVQKLAEVDRQRQQFSDVYVPIDVFRYVDAGKNPQMYTRECMERALAKNEVVKGQIETLRRFRELLMADLSKVFPEEMSVYVKATEEASSSASNGKETNSE